jgi:perosamine synthetase
MSAVEEFEAGFADYVGARYAIALCNGTATLHTALVALGVNPGDRVAVPPLTMSATTIAVLHAGAVPVFVDVDPETWLMGRLPGDTPGWAMPVSIYGLNWPVSRWDDNYIDDAAQTLRPHSGCAFTSYSFQASKILALGEGGMLVTDDEALATRAREFSSLGYRMDPKQPRIDKAALKHPTFARHHSLGWNYRMSEIVAERAMDHSLWYWDQLRGVRQTCADLYMEAVQGCDWLTPQHVPEGWGHDYWTYAVACDTPERAKWLLDAMERRGGERPYPAWMLTYREPAFKYLVNDRSDKPPFRSPTVCPVAESLQPRLCQFQTNNIRSAEKNAKALRRAIEEVG